MSHFIALARAIEPQTRLERASIMVGTALSRAHNARNPLISLVPFRHQVFFTIISPSSPHLSAPSSWNRIVEEKRAGEARERPSLRSFKFEHIIRAVFFPPVELSKDGGGPLECRERWDTMGRSFVAPLARNSERLQLCWRLQTWARVCWTNWGSGATLGQAQCQFVTVTGFTIINH